MSRKAPVSSEDFNVIRPDSVQISVLVRNLSTLVKCHRSHIKGYTISDDFYQDSIEISNQYVGSELYYQQDMFLTYLSDLALSYFQDIQREHRTRLTYIENILNFTLQGKTKHEMYENKDFMAAVHKLFPDKSFPSETTLDITPLRTLEWQNIMAMCSYIYEIEESCEEAEQAAYTLEQLGQHRERMRISLVEDKMDYKDWLYLQNIQLQILKVKFERDVLARKKKRLTETFNEDSPEHKLLSLYGQVEDTDEIYEGLLMQLEQVNSQNRRILRGIQKNINIQVNCGRKCIVLDRQENRFGSFQQLKTVQEVSRFKLQRIRDSECMQKQLLVAINQLKLRQLADSIEKIYQIYREEDRDHKPKDLIFMVEFENIFGLSKTVLAQKEFLKLNAIREESTLISYLIPMKSRYSYISHNIYTFIKLWGQKHQYDRSIKTEAIIKTIKNKISRHKNLGRSYQKQFYEKQFYICHNCRMLCHRLFLKICERRIRMERTIDPIFEDDSDSLYLQRAKETKKGGMIYTRCGKYYCLYCIKNQFMGRLFTGDGSCPACAKNCPCNICLRERVIVKLTDLYLFVGGNEENIKQVQQLLAEMSYKCPSEQPNERINIRELSLKSDTKTDQQVRPYEKMIERQLAKGYTKRLLMSEIKQQQQLVELIQSREKIKLKQIELSNDIFREKLKAISPMFVREVQPNVQTQMNEAKKLAQEKTERQMKRMKERQKQMLERQCVPRQRDRSKPRQRDPNFLYNLSDDLGSVEESQEPIEEIDSHSSSYTSKIGQPVKLAEFYHFF